MPTGAWGQGTGAARTRQAAVVRAGRAPWIGLGPLAALGLLACAAAGDAPPTREGGAHPVDLGPACADECGDGGATRCDGTRQQECRLTDGGCRAWSAPAPCPAGQQCDPRRSACGDVCVLPEVDTACSAYAQHYAQCCGGSVSLGILPARTAVALCEDLVGRGRDPLAECVAGARKSCAQLHDDLLPARACCCPQSTTCDPTRAGACSPTCIAHGDCQGSPLGSACVPVVDGDHVAARAWVCKADDGGGWHGCNGGLVTCGNGFDCWGDPQHGNLVCARSCNDDAACGNPGVACCVPGRCHNLVLACGGKGACLPCP